MNIPPNNSAVRVAIIGGGWAGMAAAYHLAAGGARVCVFEAAPSLGGRARGLWVSADALRKNLQKNNILSDLSELPTGWQFDSGQHILIGAYADCLHIMTACGVRVEEALLRTPLALVDAQRRGLQVTRTGAGALDVFAAIVTARGWTLRDRTALLAWLLRWRLRGFGCDAQLTLSQICHDLPATVQRQFIAPLCESALNLPPQRASAALFLRVLADGLMGAGASDLLLPRRSLAALLPEPVAAWLHTYQRGNVHTGARIAALHRQGAHWRLECDKNGDCNQNLANASQQTFDHVLIATGAAQAARLAAPHAAHWAELAAALPHTAIATVYAYTAAARMPPQNAAHAPHAFCGRLVQKPFCGEVSPPAHDAPSAALTLAAAMVALHTGPAQFAFDRAHTHGQSQAGVIALVASNCGHYENIRQLSHDAIVAARQQLHLPDLVEIKTLMDKRAAFSAEPGIIRPPMKIDAENKIWACGDYVQGIYPATLEGAVRSGKMAAHAILQTHCPS